MIQSSSSFLVVSEITHIYKYKHKLMHYFKLVKKTFFFSDLKRDNQGEFGVIGQDFGRKRVSIWEADSK